MVSKNPVIGSPEEKEMYKPMTGVERVHSHEEFARARFEGRNNFITSTYHENILNWVSVILDVTPDHESVFERAAMTALVKCESVSDKTAGLPEFTKGFCASKFLLHEIQALKPKYLLALGGEAYRYRMKPEKNTS